jgi:hypothetical protein
MRRTAPSLLLLSFLVGCDGGSTTDDADDSTVVTGDPEVVEFLAAAEAVPRGEPVELRWKVKNARTVTIFSATEILVSTDQLEGTVMTLPIKTKSGFTLRATGSGPATGSSVEVAAIWPEPTIQMFTATPEMTFIQGTTMLTWMTDEVETVRILDNGNLVPNATFKGSLARSSALTVIVNSATTTYTLEAINPTFTKTAEVHVVAGEPPQVKSFTATPRTFVESSTIVTLTWDSTGFDRIELQANFSGPVPNFPQTPSGSYEYLVNTTTEFYFLGYLGDIPYGQNYAITSRAGQEYEPNDDMNFAYSITYEGGIVGSIGNTNDVDYYLIDVYEPMNLRIWTRGEGTGCPTDTSIELIEAFRGTGATLGTDSDSGIPTGRGGACAEIHPDRDAYVQAIFGSYFIVVRGERGETGPYALMTSMTRP